MKPKEGLRSSYVSLSNRLFQRKSALQIDLCDVKSCDRVSSQSAETSNLHCMATHQDVPGVTQRCSRRRRGYTPQLAVPELRGQSMFPQMLAQHDYERFANLEVRSLSLVVTESLNQPYPSLHTTVFLPAVLAMSLQLLFRPLGRQKLRPWAMRPRARRT